MRVTFTGNNSVQIVREEVPGPTLTTIATIPFEGGMQFLRLASLPDLTTAPLSEVPGSAGRRRPWRSAPPPRCAFPRRKAR